MCISDGMVCSCPLRPFGSLIYEYLAGVWCSYHIPVVIMNSHFYSIVVLIVYDS